MTWVYGPREHQLNQGDLYESVPFHLPVGKSDVSSDFERMLGLVTSHGCDCEKYDRAVQRGQTQETLDRMPLLAAPVHDLEDLNASLAGDVRKVRVPRYFYMPADEHQPELVADLWFEQPVAIPQLLDLEHRATLDEEWRLKLIVQIFRLRSHLKEESVFKEDWADET